MSSRDGYLLCNWNARAMAVVMQLHSKLLRADEGTWIEVIDPNPPDLADLPDVYSDVLQGVRFTRGHPGDPNVLRGVDLTDVRCAILLASSDEAQRADAETLLTVEALRSARADCGADLRAIVEIVDPAHRRYLRHLVGATDHWIEVLTATEVEAHVFSQAVRVHGMVGFYFDLLSFSAATNEAYRIPVAPPLVGESFSAAFFWLRASARGRDRQLPVGVARGGGLHIETNPDDSEPLGERDELVVLAFEPPRSAAETDHRNADADD